MDWTSQLFNYCERGSDPSFWAEPFNAVSNAAFLIAAAIAGLRLARLPQSVASLRPEWALISLAGLVGIGSFLFHTFATRWAVAADTGAIFAFTYSYFGYALRRYFGLGWFGTIAGLLVLLAGFVAAAFAPCDPGLLPITAAAGRSCLNGSLEYLPVIAALAIVGGLLLARGHPAGRYIAAAGAVFAVSLTLRTLDIEICALTDFFGKVRGTHALWHCLNATTLYLLLAAAIAARARPA